MKLVVGLGHPGAKYEGTRHNVGFETVERLARECGATARPKFEGDVWECTLDGLRALLLEPRTFMNRSGSSVRKAYDFYQLELDDLLVICDDFNLPLGQLRIRDSGSDGGQNGLADVIRCMGTKDFARLRIGIGPVPERWNAADFVLGRFTPQERTEAELQVARAAEAAKLWAARGVGPAANQYNVKP
jgi:PTH1 family peptidyl-tRNA hydrolase